MQAKYELSPQVLLPAAVNAAPCDIAPDHVTPPSVERWMKFWRMLRPPPFSFIVSIKTVPSLPRLPVTFTDRWKLMEKTVTGALHVTPSSVERASRTGLLARAKSLNATYCLP